MTQLVVVASNGVVRPLGTRQRVGLIEEFLDWGRNIRGYRPETIRMYGRTLRRVERLTFVKLEELDEDTVIEFLRNAHQRYAASTFRTYRNCLGGFFRWAMEWEYIEVNPLRRVPSAKRPDPEPKPYSATEVRRIAQAAVALSSEHACVAGLGLYAGLRRTEMRDLRWSHISGDMLTVREGKGGKTRNIPAHPMLQVLLERRYLVSAAYSWRTWVLEGRDGQRSPNYVGTKLWGDIRKVAGLSQNSNLHRCRHSFGCSIWRGSRDLMALKDALGHESPATVAYYVKADDPALRAAIENLDWGQ